jgi:hypothetical protein
MDLRDTGWGDMDWIHLAQDREQWRAFVNTVMNLWFTSRAGKLLSSSGATGGFSRRTQLHGVSSFIIYSLNLMLIDSSHQGRWHGRDM